MKKVISVLMAITMLAALMVPAFALDKTLDENTKSDTAEVKTNYDNLEATGGYYTVTFPAETTIAWGTVDTTIKYNVSTQLIPTATLNVTVAQNNPAMEKQNALDTDPKLTYTLSGDTNVTGISPFVTDEEHTLNINITKDAWGDVPVDDYSDQLTFTATVAGLPSNP